MNISPQWLQSKVITVQILDFISDELKNQVLIEDGNSVRTSLEKYRILSATLIETKASLRYYYKNNNTPENDALYNRAVDLFESINKSISAHTTILSYNKQEQLLNR